jgi:predicted ribosome quality control (RQC) complex YloA/Tae2 family protein
MKDLLENESDATIKDTRLLKVGRHFRLDDSLKVVVGRNHDENEKLEKMAANDDFFFYPDHDGVRGPLTVIRGSFDKEMIERIGGITARYCSGTDGEPVRISYRKKSSASAWSVMASPVSEEMIEQWRV